MADSLISLLNTGFSRSLDPDAIVRLVNNQGWVQGKDFTQSICDEWQDKQVRVFHRRSRDLGTYIFMWDEEYAKGSLPEHYFILETNFLGEYPDVQSDDQDYS